MKSKIIEQIGKGQINEAIQELLEMSNSPHYNEIILISSRFGFYNDQVRRGIISFENSSLTFNAIVNSLLELLKVLEFNLETNPGKKHESTDDILIDQNSFEFAYQLIGEVATMTYIDVMRLLCVSSASDFFNKNVDRYPEFINVAQEHFEDLQNQISRYLNKIPLDLQRILKKVERQFQWTLRQLIHIPSKVTYDPGVFQTMLELSENIHTYCMNSKIQKYLIESEIVQNIAEKQKQILQEQNNFDLDFIWNIRLQIQSEVLANHQNSNRRLGSINEDSMYELSFFYFSIDYLLIPFAVR